MIKAGTIFELKPINNRFSNLITQHGNLWITVSDSRDMPCFNGQIGVTARPQNNLYKISNFRVDELK